MGRLEDRPCKGGLAHGRSSRLHCHNDCAAFGVIAALAWNSAITDLIKAVFPAGQGIGSEFVYAIIITVIGVLIMVNLGKIAERAGGKSTV